jgi:hypothetical protein
MQLRPYQTQLVTEIRGQYQLGRKGSASRTPYRWRQDRLLRSYSPIGQRQGQPRAHPCPQG